MQKSQSAKLWLRGEVDFEDMTADGWFDMGVCSRCRMSSM